VEKMSSETSGIIKELRKNKGMTQAELAECCGVTQQAVGLWEKGGTCPDIGAILKLSQIFSVTTDYLLTGTLSLAGKKVGPVTPEEARIVEQYRELAPEGREAIKTMLKALGGKAKPQEAEHEVAVVYA